MNFSLAKGRKKAKKPADKAVEKYILLVVYFELKMGRGGAAVFYGQQAVAKHDTKNYTVSYIDNDSAVLYHRNVKLC